MAALGAIHLQKFRFFYLKWKLIANKRIYEGKGHISSSFMTDFVEFGRIDTRGASGLFIN